MNKVGSLPLLRLKQTARWHQYVGDSLLAIGCIILLTAIFSLFHLYRVIPDSVVMYLLVILIPQILACFSPLLEQAIALVMNKA
ncbi:MAG: hypothetical protein H0V70_12040 [Ktedonobacteraceae bacterium]|nr:hypothetical protein [Ktedonobacteraceae bacterium]